MNSTLTTALFRHSSPFPSPVRCHNVNPARSPISEGGGYRAPFAARTGGLRPAALLWSRSSTGRASAPFEREAPIQVRSGPREGAGKDSDTKACESGAVRDPLPPYTVRIASGCRALTGSLLVVPVGLIVQRSRILPVGSDVGSNPAETSACPPSPIGKEARPLDG